ncbi:cellulose binding domain-containing protein [Saccharothrix luteola]|uniref:cellulose binding domain-containing protein n=1 Tax=Saccharothrix luteola TaxID=2893018 RepID=UPI001E42CA14|nr:cellulose binding domain-containing protein [Saccharothrix luteola]MCC8242881.1 cellulose-binding domain-containing protein [Saccharothrix luteola]
MAVRREVRTRLTLPALIAAVVVVLSGFSVGHARAESPTVVVDHGGTSYAVMPGSGSAVVRLSLSGPPAAATSVTIALAGTGASGPVFVSSRRTLTFTPADWNVPQPVRIISLRDFGTAAFRVTGPGVADGVIQVYSSTIPLPPNVNQSCRITHSTHSWPGGFATTATVTNTGTAPITDWTVSALFDGDEQVVGSWPGEWGQYGRGAAFAALPGQRVLTPGASVTIGFHGRYTQRVGGPWLRCTPEPYLLPTTTPTPTTTPGSSS